MTQRKEKAMAKVKVDFGGRRFKEKGDVVLAICAGDSTRTAFVGDIDEETAYKVGFAFGGLVGTVEDEDRDLARCMRAGLHASLELEI